MKIRSLTTTSHGNLFRCTKFITLASLCLISLHFFSLSFFPSHHENFILNIKSGIQQVKQIHFEEVDSMEFGIEPEYRKYIEELGLKDPGEYGAAVILPKNISDEIKKKVEEGYNRHGFNAFVSNLISIDRKLTDTRSEECKMKRYDNLPKCSVVIPFYNEEWTLLLRTVHGVINRSPDHLIEEIVLVDDASDRGS